MTRRRAGAPGSHVRRAGEQRPGTGIEVTPAVTWLLLRGLARGSAHWAGFDASCRAAWPGARVLTLDVPGNGLRWAQRSPAHVPDMTDALRASLRDAVGPQGPGRLHLLGVSMGGMIAADWIHRYPQELAAAVLVNTSVRPLSPWWQRMRPAALMQLAGLALRQGSPVEWERIILALTSSQAERRAAVLPTWAALRQQQPVSGRNILRQLLAAARWHVPLHAPSVPVLLLSGSGDHLVDPRCSASLARQWGCLLLSHPSAGHDLTLDDGAWVLEQVQSWMRSEDAGQV